MSREFKFPVTRFAVKYAIGLIKRLSDLRRDLGKIPRGAAANQELSRKKCRASAHAAGIFVLKA
jgi:hypothetical protein